MGTETPDRQALSYEAPHLVSKLLKERIVMSRAEGVALFGEVKKFLALTQSDDNTCWTMYSSWVDAAWHQFILFTEEYANYCHRFYGRYISHRPNEPPQTKAPGGSRAQLTFGDFRRRYAEMFGSPLPDVWYDEKCVCTSSRILNDDAGRLGVRTEGGLLHLVSPSDLVLLTANALAQEALMFISRNGAFYVRELPDDLTDEEKVALVATLVQVGVLRLAG